MRVSKRLFAMLIVVCMILELCMIPYNRVEATKGGQYLIKVNRKQCCVTIYEKDEAGEYTIPVKAMACSVGKNNATPKGTFKLSEKYRWHLMFFNVYAQYCTRITDHILFHSVCYNDKDPARLRYRDYNKLGEPASHGCIRLSTGDAKWIYDHCKSGTIVKIFDSDKEGPLGKPTPIRIDEKSAQRNWDPTDPNKKNPWRKVAPTIKFAQNMSLERGSDVSDLKKMAQATNYLNRKIKVTVSGNYNLKEVGSYSVRFRAEDYLGNVTRKTIKIKVIDTKNPVIFFGKKTMTLYDEDLKTRSKTELKTILLENISAYDSRELLPKEYIRIEMDELYNAIKKKKYGEYKILVNAKDKAFNDAPQRILTVLYKESLKEEPDPGEKLGKNKGLNLN